MERGIAEESSSNKDGSKFRLGQIVYLLRLHLFGNKWHYAEQQLGFITKETPKRIYYRMKNVPYESHIDKRRIIQSSTKEVSVNGLGPTPYWKEIYACDIKEARVFMRKVAGVMREKADNDLTDMQEFHAISRTPIIGLEDIPKKACRK